MRAILRSLLIETVVRVGVARLFLRTELLRANRRGFPLLRVVNLHGTPLRHEGKFRRQVEWVCRHFHPVTLEDLGAIWSSAMEAGPPRDRPWVLFTFDDGLASNYHVAAPVLESLGARGLFFVVPAFSASKGEEARAFYYRQIRLSSVPEACPEEDWAPMTGEEIADLAARGHGVGNHTFTHPKLDTVPPGDLRHEIAESADVIFRWTGKPVTAFTWTFLWKAISFEAWNLARERHSWVFAPCPGTVHPARDAASLIWRTNVDASYGPSDYRFMYSGLGDIFWRSQRSRLRKMLLEGGVRRA